METHQRLQPVLVFFKPASERFPLPDVAHIMDVACFGAVPCGGLEELHHNKGIDRWYLGRCR